MATKATDVGAPYTPGAVNLANAQTGNGVSTDILDRGARTAPMGIQIVTTVGATPTATFALEGSMDGTSWFAVPYTDPATPDTSSISTIVITTATTTRRFIRGGFPYRFFRVNVTSNTNVTFTIDVFVY